MSGRSHSALWASHSSRSRGELRLDEPPAGVALLHQQVGVGAVGGQVVRVGDQGVFQGLS